MSEYPPGGPPPEPEHPSTPPQFVQYPRGYGQVGAGGWGAPNLDLAVISRAWTAFQSNMGTWIGAGFVGGAVFAAIYAGYFAALMAVNPAYSGIFTGKPQQQTDISQIMATLAVEFGGGFVLATVAFTLNASLMSLALSQLRGETPTVAKMFDLRGQAVHIVVAGIVTTIAVQLGTMLCCIPGLLLQGLFMFTIPIILDQRVTAFDGIRLSIEKLKSQMWMALLVFLVLEIVGSLGAMACLVGVLFTYPIYILSIALLYRDFYWQKPEQAY